MTTHDHDERPAALIHAAAGADAWQSASVTQPNATPDHADFYALTGEVVDTLQALSRICSVQRSQIAGYGTDRTVLDDVPGHDPAERLITACGLAGLLQRDLDVAERGAQRFWAEISHIATEAGR